MSAVGDLKTIPYLFIKQLGGVMNIELKLIDDNGRSLFVIVNDRSKVKTRNLYFFGVKYHTFTKEGKTGKIIFHTQKQLCDTLGLEYNLNELLESIENNGEKED